MLLHVIPHNCSEMHRNVAIPDYRSLVTQTSGMDICQIGYDICEFDSLRGLGIDIIGRVHFDKRDTEIDLLYWWAVLERRLNHVNKRVVADIWLLTVSWTLTWDMIQYEIFIASCADNIYDFENERWLLGDMIDHVGIYGSRVAEGLSAFNVGLVTHCDLLMPYGDRNLGQHWHR